MAVLKTINEKKKLFLKKLRLMMITSYLMNLIVSGHFTRVSAVL